MNVRCYTCNASLAYLERSVDDMMRRGVHMARVLDVHGISRMCCRTAYITRVPEAGSHCEPRVDRVLDHGTTKVFCEARSESVVDCNDGSMCRDVMEASSVADGVVRGS
jgi:DNA-directed RNA polymerase subunit N (RpoN/RPB10)